MENYVAKAKDQIEFWQEQLELAEKILATKTNEKDFEDGLYIAAEMETNTVMIFTK